MSGFRQFSQQRAPINPRLLELTAAAKLQLEEDWEEEFLTSVTLRIEQGWDLSAKQLETLEKLAAGFYAEQREAYHQGADQPDEAWGGD